MLVYQRVSEFFCRFAQLRSPVSSCWALWVRPSSRHFGQRLKRGRVSVSFRFGDLKKVWANDVFDDQKKFGDWWSVTGIKCGGGGWLAWKKKADLRKQRPWFDFGARGRGRWAKLYRTTFPVFLRCQPSRTFRSGENFWGWSWSMEILRGKRGKLKGVLLGGWVGR